MKWLDVLAQLSIWAQQSQLWTELISQPVCEVQYTALAVIVRCGTAEAFTMEIFIP